MGGNVGGIPSLKETGRMLSHRPASNYLISLHVLARPAGFEPTTPWFVASTSNCLYYSRVNNLALARCTPRPIKRTR